MRARWKDPGVLAGFRSRVVAPRHDADMDDRTALTALLPALGPLADHFAALIAARLPVAAPSPAPEPLVTRHELARLLAVSIATVDRLDREGQPYVRIGDAKRYDVGAVFAWHRERTAAEPRTTAPTPRLPPAPAARRSEPEPVAAPSGVRRVSVGGRRAGR